MTPLLFAALLAATIAGLVTHLLVPVMIAVGGALQPVDRPAERRRPAAAVPRLGGVAIVAGLALAACGVAMMQWREWGIAVGRSELVALGIGTLLVFLVGVVDDVLGVSVTKKLLFQLAAAYLLVQLGWSFQVLHLPGLGDVQLGVWGDLVSLLWIVGVTNAINLIDGLDGLAGGVVAIIALGLLTQALLQGEPLTVVLMGAMAGATIGFLAHNWSPARIFMGDSGSLTLGFLLAVMSVHSSLKAPAAVAILIPVLALGLPVIDTLLVMGVRFLDQPHGRLGDRFLRMFHADRNHLHHTLERFVANRRRIVGSIYGAVLVFCVMALAVAITRNATLGLVLVCVQVAAVVVMRNWGRLVQTGGRLVRAGPQVISAGNGALRKGQDVARVLPAGRKRRRQG